MIVLVPLLVLGVVMAFAFAGCAPFTAAPDDPPVFKWPFHPRHPAKTGGNGGKGSTLPPVTTTPAPIPATYATKIEADANHYWRLDDAPAPGNVVAADSTWAMKLPGQYNGTVTRGPAVIGVLALGKEKNDTASSFDKGPPAGYVEVGYDQLLNPPDSFTIEAWVKLDPNRPLQTGDVTTVLGSYEVKPLERGFVLDLLFDPNGILSARVRVGNPTASKFRPLMTPLGLAHSGWYHLVATYDRAADILRLYVNARAPAELPNAADNKPAGYGEVTTVGVPLRIGAGQVEAGANRGQPAAFFRGVIDEVALYNVALDLAAVQDHFTFATTP
jgi:hypothetical protein